MYFIKNILNRIRLYTDSAVESSPATLEERLQIKQYFFFVLVGVPITVLFGLYNLLTHNWLLSGLVLAAAVLILSSWFTLLRLPRRERVFRVNILCAGTLFCYLFIQEDHAGAKALWLFFYPLAAIFLLGKKEGLRWALGLLLASLVLNSVTHLSQGGASGHSLYFLTRFTVVYGIVCTFTYWYEFYRSNYYGNLQNEQQKFQEILTYSRDILYRRNSATNEYEYISKAFEKILGYSAEETSSFRYDDIKKLIHPEDHSIHNDIFPEILLQSPPEPLSSPVEFRMRHKQGHYLWFSDQTAALPGPDGKSRIFIGNNREITAQRDTRLALQEANNRLFTILNSIDAHIYVADMQSHKILFMNNRIEADFGTGNIGKICHEVFRNTPEPCEHCTNAMLLDRKGQPTGMHEWERYNPVTGRWYNNYDRAIKWIDGRWVRIQIAVDISRIRNLERERKRADAVINKARHLKAIGTFAGGIAHDFNNLLQIIIGNASLAASENNPDVRTSFYENITIAAEKAKNLAKQMVTLSPARIERPTPIFLGLTLERIVQSAISKQQANIQADLRIDELLWQTPVDCDQITAAIDNIVVNACDSIDKEGTITIAAENYQHLKSEQDTEKELEEGKYVKICIHDNGRGLGEDELQKIFDPYYSTKAKGAQKGLGLGMALTYAIISKHEGYIFISSSKGEGTRVTLFLKAEYENNLES